MRVIDDHDCYHRALPGEPRFTLLARDPRFFRLVNAWADDREQDVLCGERPKGDFMMVLAARKLAIEGQAWRRDNFGLWRRA